MRDLVYHGYCGKYAIHCDICVLCVINVSCAMIHVVVKAKNKKNYLGRGFVVC